ncbi:MAG: alanine racemase [Rhodospirillales bacterium]|jgi:alanine racemase|nr:alanine racemase [Rhodospirillales bacterium]
MSSSLPDTWFHASGRLLIDLNTIASNYRTLKEQMADKACGACVKANCYGLGMDQIAPTLANEGCEDFFVSFLEGGIKLRAILPKARIHVFTGLSGGKPQDFVDYNLIPALNSLGEIQEWSDYCSKTVTRHTADIQIDTGMQRLGLPQDEIESVLNNPSLLGDLDIDLVFTHLACADTPSHPMNRQQLDYFTKVYERFGANRASLANSSGIFLGSDYHFDLARPGAALYGINPILGKPSPMAQVVRLQGKILQTRHVDTPQSVGYGATHRISEKGRIATVGVGYADGYLRSLSEGSLAHIGDIPVPVVGRVSMDMITLDISNVPEHMCSPGMIVDLIGPHQGVDTLAEKAGTIGYEILTSLGGRYYRTYLDGNEESG